MAALDRSHCFMHHSVVTVSNEVVVVVRGVVGEHVISVLFIHMQITYVARLNAVDRPSIFISYNSHTSAQWPEVSLA